MPADPTPPVPPDAPRLLSVVEELEGLLAKATERPWFSRAEEGDLRADVCSWVDRRLLILAVLGDEFHDGSALEDAALIVAAVNALPDLLAAARLAATLQAHQEQAVVVRGGEVVGTLDGDGYMHKNDGWFRVWPMPADGEVPAWEEDGPDDEAIGYLTGADVFRPLPLEDKEEPK